MPNPDIVPCEFLPWDSSHFGQRIARITTNTLDVHTGRAAVAWCRDHRIDCVCLRIGAEDDASIDAAEQCGFHLVDVRLTLDASVRPSQPATDPRVRTATAADLEALEALARVSHRNTRFYSDRRFERAKADELYATWIRRSLKGELAEQVLVTCEGDAVLGYVSLYTASPDTGQIGLIAVSAQAQGQGRGDLLLREAFRWLEHRALTRVQVVTQGRSAPSVRFYEKCGFRSRLVELWYHLWLDRV
jgi:dTDP-4-amino-4,6-dideoxy-D-galactose acyltransferase